MATKQGPIENLPIAKHSIIHNLPSKKYEVGRDPFTNIIIHEIDSFNIKIRDPKPKHFYYGIRVVTGAQADAGTIGDVYVILIGNAAKTEKVLLEGFFLRKVASKTYKDFVVECNKDLGEVQLVTVGHDGEGIDAIATWFVDYTLVKQYAGEKESIFSCFHWIGAGDYFTNAARCGTLQQVGSNEILKEDRKRTVKNRQETYGWQKYTITGMPSSIDSEPRDERFDLSKSITFLGNLFKGAVFSAESAFFKIVQDILNDLFKNETPGFNELTDFSQYYEVAKLIQKDQEKTDVADRYNRYVGPVVPYYLARWTSDVEFGRQILNGVNCVIIKRCTALPANFPVTQEMVSHSLARTGDLKSEMEAGYVYICDLSGIMDGLTTKEDNYCAAPLCLLYVNSAFDLIPIAIQLKKQSGPDNPIFLPTDNRFDWMIAKIFFASASSQMHQLSSHYITCHAAMEAYGVATMRTLPDAHPVYKLLRPSIHYTMAINARARAALINDGGIIDFLFSIGGNDANSGKNELIARANKMYNVHLSNVNKNIAERGVGDAEKLPNYFYRDDGCKLWDAIEKYVSSIIDLFYAKDTDVADDVELQNWVSEVHTEAFPAFGDNPTGRGFPSKITNKPDLVEYCTLIMFTGSVQHSAVNFGQFQIYGFVPNSPMTLRQPPPTQKGIQIEDDIHKVLPHGIHTLLAATVTFSLSQYSPGEIFLGGYPQQWFTEKEAQHRVTLFEESLKKIAKDIETRNKKLEIPYLFLSPNRCPVSITI